MTRPMLTLFAALVALAPAISVHAQEAAPETTEAAPPPQMHFGDWGIDTAGLDPAIRPGDDFFAYVNRRWIAENPIPAEHGRYGAFTMLNEKSQADVRALVDELVAQRHAPGSLEQRIVDSYRAYLDQRAIDAAGLAPAWPYLSAIYQAKSLEELAVLFGKPGYPSPIGAWVMVDQKQPDRYTVGLGAGAMGLPDRDYYLKTDDKSREIQSKYRAYMAFLLGKAGYADPDGVARTVYAFEDSFARLAWDRAVARNRDLTYNELPHAEVSQLAGVVPLDTMLAVSGLGEVNRFVVPQIPPSAEKAKELGLSAEDLAKIGGGFPAMMKLLEETPLATIQAWMAVRFLSGNSDVLPREIDDAAFDFFGRTLRGTQEQRPRWKRAIDNVEGQLGEALGQSYVTRYFPPENKAAMDALVSNLRKAMAQSLAENAWMSDATKAEAEGKLALFTTKIGYPDKFKTYDGLQIAPDKPLENGVAAGAWGWRDDLAKLGGPVDRSEWFMLPQTVNAYYNPTTNEIVFPAGILQPPFFNAQADMAVNYGAIGAVIGHEIGHGFDDQGAKSDGTGMLRDWWSEADGKAFAALGAKLAAQYDRMCPLDDGKTCVNGRLTLGENIGDLAGLSLALRAYRMALGGKEAPVIDGFTGEQRFFLAWAQVWRAANREDNLRQRLVTDPHSPEQFRVNGVVRNMDAWYDAFGVNPGDALYLPPEERVRIW